MAGQHQFPRLCVPLWRRTKPIQPRRAWARASKASLKDPASRPRIMSLKTSSGILALRKTDPIPTSMSSVEAKLQTNVAQSREALDAWVREVVQWHFDPATGCPFWLEYAKSLDWDPRKEIQSYDDLSRFGFFQDEWLRGGPV